MDESFKTAGVDDFIEKPVDGNDLISRVNALLPILGNKLFEKSQFKEERSARSKNAIIFTICFLFVFFIMRYVFFLSRKL